MKLIKPLTENEIDSLSNASLSQFIDHTMLKANAGIDAFDKLCEEAKQYKFCSVCVNSCHVAYVAQKLKGTDIGICSVVGFPLGAMDTVSKAFEAEQAVKQGATEIDMVINIGALKDKNYKYVEDDIRAVRKATGKDNILKVIIEACLLTDEEKVKACQICVAAKADFVKTSTGFSTGGATIEDVALMRKTVGPNIGVKAAGGIRTAKDARSMLKAGATRIGCGQGVSLVTA